MKKKKNISKEEFLNYLNSEKGSERHSLERDALSDPFMNEALEGYDDWNREESLKAVKELEQRIKPAGSNWRMIGMAASVVLMITLTGIWIANLSESSKQLAVNADKPTVGNKNKEMDSVLTFQDNTRAKTIHTNPSDGVLPEDGEESPTPRVNPGAEFERNGAFEKSTADCLVPKEELAPIQNSTAVIERKVDVPMIQEPIKEIARSETEDDLVLDEIADSQQEQRKDSKVYKKAKRSVTSAKTLPASPASDQYELSSGSTAPAGYASLQKMNIVKDLYAKKEFTKSLVLCSEILISEPDHQDAIFYSGLNERSLNHPEAAVRHLEKVTKSSVFYYQSKWNLYELSGSDSTRSNAILRELASEPNDFQEKAKALLGF